MSDHLPCPGCPHPHKVHAHQMWRQPGPKTYTKIAEPWNSRLWKVRHPGMGAGRRALRWLEVTFGQGRSEWRAR